MASYYIELPPAGGGGGAVTSVNGFTGAVVLTKSNIGLSNVQNVDTTIAANIVNVPTAPITATTVQGAIDELATLTPTVTGPNDAIVRKDGVGALITTSSMTINNAGGLSLNNTVDLDNTTSYQVNRQYVAVDPTVASPNFNAVLQDNFIEIDIHNNGIDFGTNGSAALLASNTMKHFGSSDTGSLQMISNNFQIGNGTDPISINGFGYLFGFGTIASGVTVQTGGIQGYGFQPAIQAGAIVNTYVNGFYDNLTSAVPIDSYNSANFSPSLHSIENNGNFAGVSINPQFSSGFTGNSGFNGVSVNPSLGAMGTGGINGYFFNGTATNVNSGYGVFIDTSNLTPYAGTVSSLVVQDITFTYNLPGNNNAFQIEYVNDVLAGSENFTISGNLITGHIESGVSTATQVLAAHAANLQFSSAVGAVITGMASNPQVAAAATNFAGGTDPGNVKAGYFNGDVQIDGALSFTGGLSLGALNSFAPQDISGFPGGVNSISTLITQPTAPANTTLNTDLLAINTAMLMDIGDNSVLTSSFLGYAALGLPAVVKLGINTTIDRVGGATFAISMDGAAGAGSSIASVDLCRAIAIPNGITAVTQLKGYAFDLPFGDPGTTTWGLYSSPTTAHNYIAGDLVVGTADTPTNSSVGIEIVSTAKALLLSRMTSAEKNALTAVAGMVVFDTTLSQLSYYNGTTWINL